MYNSRVDVGTRLRRDLRRVAPFFCATRQELSYSPPFSFHVPSRGEKDDRGGQGGKARDRDARDWPMGFFGAARGSPRGLASNLLRIHIQRDDNRSL